MSTDRQVSLEQSLKYYETRAPLGETVAQVSDVLSTAEHFHKYLVYGTLVPPKAPKKPTPPPTPPRKPRGLEVQDPMPWRVRSKNGRLRPKRYVTKNSAKNSTRSEEGFTVEFHPRPIFDQDEKSYR